MKTQVLELLKENKGEFITGKYIVERASLKNKVELRGIINNLRNNNEPIISSSRGYKYSTSKEEIIQCSTDLKNRARSIYQASEGLLDSLVNIS